jgi:hypothetical protein
MRSEAVGARTQDLRIKSPLLYQLSYSLAKGLTVASCDGLRKWRICMYRRDETGRRIMHWLREHQSAFLLNLRCLDNKLAGHHARTATSNRLD